MPREAKLEKPSLSPFTALVWEALEHYHNPTQLGQNSPLAQAYFLGQDLLEMSVDDISPQQRGMALVKLIQRAYHSLIQRKVDVRLLQACFIAPQSQVVEDETGKPKTKPIGLRDRLKQAKINHATFYNSLVKTELPQRVEQLAEVILQQRRLALRLEQPPSPPPLYEREALVQRCRDILVNDKTAVGLVGASGLGKTALGQYLAQSYFQGRVFWFTFRPHLNDRLLELLFNLGHFCQLYLQQLNAGQNSALLTTLIGFMQSHQAETLPQETLLNAWRADLAVMPTPPLLCFDEVDILHYDTPQHEALLHFLQNLLSDPVPLIFIGQELPFIVPQSYALVALTAEEGLAKLLSYHGLTLSLSEQEYLHNLTRGNPRWLELWVVFYQLGGKLSDFSQQLPYHALLERINQRLTPDDLALLYELAVFRQAAPMQAWANQATLLSRLEQHHLIDHDPRGGVQVRAHWRDYFIKQLKPTTAWQLCHDKAAEICIQQGQFTAALFHYIQAQNYPAALTCWQEHRQSEIEHGQGEQALTLLEAIPDHELTKDKRLILTELLVELYKLRGHYAKALATLAPLPQQGKSLTDAHLCRLKGDILELRGENERARQTYQTGLAIIEQLLVEKAMFHKNLAWMHRLAKSEDKAWGSKAEREIKQAQSQVYYVWGIIKRNQGQPHEALTFFQHFLSLAQELNDKEGMAKAQNALGIILMDRSNSWREAEICLQHALTFYQQMGRQTYLAALHGNLALLYGNKLNQPTEALTHGKASLAAYQNIGEPLGIAKAAQNLAEAFLKFGQLAEAKQYATLAQQQEIGEVIPDALRTLGEIALVERDFATAEKNLHASLEWCQQTDDSYLAGYAWRAFMQLYHATQHPELLQLAHEQAIVMFTACQESAEIAETHHLWQQLQTPY